ncbi:MAG TPA: IPT/TIG domain-containing protein [Candidatus Paceibacterota bacterium]|nr:IPT/TIG domain-containing protein [Candidatus Paceibacterota bacterium]
MHTFAAKFGALAIAPFMFFGGMGHAPSTTSWHWPGYHQPSAAMLTITKVEGPESLAVGASGTWTVDAKSYGKGNLSYSVTWGDEASAAAARPLAAMTESSATFDHEYDSAGIYHPTFTVTDANGHKASKSTTVTVGADMIAHIDSVSPASGPVGSTATITGTGFASTSEVTVGGATTTDTVLNDDGTLSFTIPSLANGTYNIRVHNGDEKSNAVSFQVIATTPHLSISGIDAPVALAVGEEGTWTVHANTDENSLHYSVQWGDEAPIPLMMMADNGTTQASATFTHAYESADTYAPKFTVTDDYGHSASASASVVVQ